MRVVAFKSILFLALALAPAVVAAAATVEGRKVKGGENNPLGKFASKLKNRVDGGRKKLALALKRKGSKLKSKSADPPEPEKKSEEGSEENRQRWQWRGTESEFNDFMSLVIPASLIVLLVSSLYRGMCGEDDDLRRLERRKRKDESKKIEDLLNAMALEASTSENDASGSGGGGEPGGEEERSETERGLEAVREEWNNRHGNNNSHNDSADAGLPVDVTKAALGGSKSDFPLDTTGATENETDDSDDGSSSGGDGDKGPSARESPSVNSHPFDESSLPSGESTTRGCGIESGAGGPADSIESAEREETKVEQHPKEEEGGAQGEEIDEAAARLLAILEDEAAAMALEQAEKEAVEKGSKAQAAIAEEEEENRKENRRAERDAEAAAREEAEEKKEQAEEDRMKRMYQQARKDVADVDARMATAEVTTPDAEEAGENVPFDEVPAEEAGEPQSPDEANEEAIKKENENVPYDEHHPTEDEEVRTAPSADGALTTAADEENADFLAAEDEAAEALALAEEDDELRYQLAEHESDVALHEALAEEARKAEEQWRAREEEEKGRDLSLVYEEDGEHDDRGEDDDSKAAADLQAPPAGGEVIDDAAARITATDTDIGGADFAERGLRTSPSWSSKVLDATTSFDDDDEEKKDEFEVVITDAPASAAQGEGAESASLSSSEIEFEDSESDDDDDEEDLALIEALEAEAAARALEATKAIDEAETAVGAIVTSPSFGKGGGESKGESAARELKMSLRRSSSMLQQPAEC